ncbi:polysaccharide pyruvyl transferase family protein [Confluentibacter sediminis]|uniref:polysaccharide pyruvyl transferase family protein n=1 Tax=Confluentibacter sediminis TaxID=2219045 RepID=UPI000DADB2B6|nr:polysaccharide pyruvyl transferase family protein [Confluentibacter sediminis]
MKIGIMTTHSSLNNGAVLQAYSLQTYLESLGHDVEFINYEEPYPFKYRNYFSKRISITLNLWKDRLNEKKYKRKGEFGNLLKRTTTVYKTLEDLQKNPPKFDVYITGSDQVWTVASRKKVRRPFYLDFGFKEVKRISYAASLGQCIVPEYMEKDMRDLLLKFDAISVRESSGVKYIQNLVGDKKDIFHAIDPTLLVEPSIFSKIFSKDLQLKQESFIVCYSLTAYNDKEKAMVNYIQNKLGSLPIKNLRNPGTCIRIKDAENIIVTPSEWLKYFSMSKINICTSFHAVVFSLVFHKQFVVISPYINKRIMSLLKLVNLENHFITDFNKQNIDTLIEKKIDWNHVDKQIETSREKSKLFLIDALTN